MYIWFPHNTLISPVRPYKTGPLKASKANNTKDLTMARVPPGFLYGFRITSPVSTRISQVHY